MIKSTTLKKLFQKEPKTILPKIEIKDGYLVSKHEYETIAKLCKIKNPKTIFEFGTFEGLTTLTLAMNSSSETKIYTLDLPQKNIPRLTYKVNYLNRKYIKKRKKLAFTKTKFNKKITKIFGDSATYNYSKFKKKIDFIFVDACHTYEYVKNDTEKALQMLKPSGVIVWHDYKSKYWPENTKFLNELSKTKNLYHIKDTQFVIYKKGLRI